MNSRRYFEIMPSEGEKKFTLPVNEHQVIFQRYLDMTYHVQELDQLYRMMLYNLEKIFRDYNLLFDDRVYTYNGQEVDVLQLNALIGNAISSARTLIESVEVFDKAYIDSDGTFKTSYISKAYDKWMAYRMVDFLRNYMQHGHVPISYDGNKIFLNLTEILDVHHMRINKALRQQYTDVYAQLMEQGAVETRLACVFPLYQYFLLVHKLYLDFWRYADWTLGHMDEEVRAIVAEHPEYRQTFDQHAFVPVYCDAAGLTHGFDLNADFLGALDGIKRLAEEKYEAYKASNGNLLILTMDYCLENRAPEMLFVDDSVLSNNLVEYCREHGQNVHHISFEKHYGSMDMHTVHEMFPYIQFEDGIQWNVPYSDVTIADFIRTFPNIRQTGICAQVNNVAGGGPLGHLIMHGWHMIMDSAAYIAEQMQIESAIDVVDWISRAEFVASKMRLLRQSFSRQDAHKPDVHFLMHYIRQQDHWNIIEMSQNMKAKPELLKMLLENLGYISGDSIHYQYDAECAEKMNQYQKKRKVEIENRHGSDVDCSAMNQAVMNANADALYYCLTFDVNQLPQAYMERLEDDRAYVNWDTSSKSFKIMEPLPTDCSIQKVYDIAEKMNQISKAMVLQCEKGKCIDEQMFL